MSNPKLAYTNFFETGIVTASSEATGYEKENAYNGLTFDGWKPDTTGTHYLTLFMSYSQSADYLVIFAHDLHKNSATVQLQYSSDNFSADINDVGDLITPIDSSVVYIEFSAITADYWRIEIVSDVSSSTIGVVMLGSSLELEQTLPVDASNLISFARENQYINNVSNAGTLLGRSLIRKGLNGVINFRYISRSWLRSNWETFMDHAEKKPFVFLSDPGNYSDEAVFCFLDGKQRNPRPSNAKFISSSLNIRGFKYSDSDLFIGWDISTTVYASKSLVTTSETTSPNSLFFKPDGLTMFLLAGGRIVYQYELSTAWDISTSDYSANSPQKNSGLIAEDIAMSGFFFQPDGTEMYIVGHNNDTIFQYTLSIPWDITTSSYSANSPQKNFDVSSQTTFPRAISISPDGLTFFIGDRNTEYIRQYSMGTAWDISTSTYDSKFISHLSTGSSIEGLFTRQNGKSIYILTFDNHRISQYDLDTPWDISTAVYSGKNISVSLQDTINRGIFIKPDGLSLYMCGDEIIYQYDIG